MIGELNREQIENVLRAEVIGRIGCHADGLTYVVPITYVYDGDCVYGHSAEGMKLRMMRENPRVCFEVDQMDNLANWRSVIAWGTFEELSGDSATRAMELLVSRLKPRIVSETATATHATESDRMHHQGSNRGAAHVYRIRLTNRTGRFEKTG